MKKVLLVAIYLLVVSTFIFSKDVDAVSSADEGNGAPSYEYPHKEKEFPSPKRPQKPSSEKIKEASSKNPEKAGDEYISETKDTFKYGLTDEVSTLLDDLTSSEDPRFVDEIYDLFQETKSPKIRRKILLYFTKLKDPCLEDYAVEIINDPYDTDKNTVNACFDYISAVKSRSAIPGIVDLIEKEEVDYFSKSIVCLGEIGGDEEALFLSSYIDRDDLSTQDLQSLVRVLGKLKALETWDKLVELAEDENANSFVRGYAAEAIGAMEKDDSVSILSGLYESEDPIVRQYAIKGLSHYDNEETKKVVIQALKDDNYKIRIDAIQIVGEHKIKQADADLIYHCKHKEETVVKDKCYKVLAELNTSLGNEYLISVIKDKKSSDTTKAKVAAALLEFNNAGSSDILSLAKDTLTDDKRKALRYALGKEFAKYGRAEYASICADYISSKDVSTQGTGLDIYAKGRYSSVKSAVEELAAQYVEDGDTGISKKAANNVNAKKAKRILENN